MCISMAWGADATHRINHAIAIRATRCETAIKLGYY